MPKITLKDFPPSRVYALDATHLESGKVLRMVRHDVNAALHAAQLMVDCGYRVHVGIERR